MARGMWSGIAAGFADIQARKLTNQERQDRLDLLTQDRADKTADRAESLRRFNLERADRQVAMGLSLSEKYAKAGITGGSNTSDPSNPMFKAAVLKKMGMNDQDIANLASSGGILALNEAITKAEKFSDPQRPLKPEDLTLIAESILVSPGYQATDEDVAEYFAGNNLDPNLFNAAAINQIKKNISRAPEVQSSMPVLQRAPDMQDLAQAEKTFVGGVTRALNALTANSEDLTLNAEVLQAQDSLTKGNSERAITILIDKYGQEGFKKLYENITSSYPEFYGPDVNIPLGVASDFKDIYDQVSQAPAASTPTRRLRYNPETDNFDEVTQ